MKGVRMRNEHALATEREALVGALIDNVLLGQHRLVATGIERDSPLLRTVDDFIALLSRSRTDFRREMIERANP